MAVEKLESASKQHRWSSFHRNHLFAAAGGETALTYAGTRLDGVAGEEAHLLRRQDFALQPQRDNGVRRVRP